jgi:quinol-cytochrome oxidoreductase complex cytochrome b subunit
MSKNKWMSLINDEISDIPGKVDQIKQKFWRVTSLMIIFAVTGGSVMGLATDIRQAALGCFLAVTSVICITSIAIIYFIQICLYKIIKEIRSGK